MALQIRAYFPGSPNFVSRDETNKQYPSAQILLSTVSKLLGGLHRMLVRNTQDFIYVDAPGSNSPGLYSYVSLEPRGNHNPFGGFMAPPVKQCFTIRNRFIYRLSEYNQNQDQNYQPNTVHQPKIDTNDVVVVRGSA